MPSPHLRIRHSRRGGHGEAAKPMVSTMVESPISGLASASVKPGKYKPRASRQAPHTNRISCTYSNAEIRPVATHGAYHGAVFDTANRIHDGLAGRHGDVKELIVTTHKSEGFAEQAASLVTEAIAGANSRNVRLVHATFRWCISSPMLGLER